MRMSVEGTSQTEVRDGRTVYSFHLGWDQMSKGKISESSSQRDKRSDYAWHCWLILKTLRIFYSKRKDFRADANGWT